MANAFMIHGFRAEFSFVEPIVADARSLMSRVCYWKLNGMRKDTYLQCADTHRMQQELPGLLWMYPLEHVNKKSGVLARLSHVYTSEREDVRRTFPHSGVCYRVTSYRKCAGVKLQAKTRGRQAVPFRKARRLTPPEPKHDILWARHFPQLAVTLLARKHLEPWKWYTKVVSVRPVSDVMERRGQDKMCMGVHA